MTKKEHDEKCCSTKECCKKNHCCCESETNTETDCKSEVDRLTEENASLKDQLIRSMAEIENIRKRSEREREEALKFAINRFSKDLLIVADTIQKALEIEFEHESDPKVKSFFDGVKLMEKELSSVFSRNGVELIKISDNEMFNPEYHQAMFEVETAEKPAGTIIQVLQNGYTLQGRLLRPSMVGVAKSSS